MGSGGIAPTFLTSGLDGVKWLSSHPGHFASGETAPVTHWIGVWVGPIAGLDVIKEIKILSFAGFETRCPSLYRLSYRGSPVVVTVVCLNIYTFAQLVVCRI
jgi:hypothetical protein